MSVRAHILWTCMIHIKEKPYLISPQSFQEFIHSLGFMDFDTWDESAWHPVVEAALSCWQKGIPCFSQAYCPSKAWRKRERSAARNPRVAVGRGLARALFQEGDGKGRKRLVFELRKLPCHQTWQAWQAGKSIENGGFNRKISELNSGSSIAMFDYWRVMVF